MITAQQAARLVSLDYADNLAGTTLARHERNGTDARIVRAGSDIVLIPTGSNDRHDWRRNMFTWAAVSTQPGESGREYHAGHLMGANELWDWLKREAWLNKITAIAGHSRGGAIGSPIAVTLGVPCLTFGCPPCVSGKGKLPGDAGVINYLRRDDPVTRMPPWLRHVGHKVWLDAPWRWPWDAHAIRHYAPFLEAVSS
jgi:hypothetical protein